MSVNGDPKYLGNYLGRNREVWVGTRGEIERLRVRMFIGKIKLINIDL